MACVREIINKGDRILRQKAAPVVRFDGHLAALLDDMRETLKNAEGVGLAAPQVGIGKRVIIALNGEELVEMVNPVITGRRGSQSETEGCLSVPGVRGLVERFRSVTVEAQDRRGEPFKLSAEGLFARILQHEIDHLEGRLFTDIMTEEVFD